MQVRKVRTEDADKWMGRNEAVPESLRGVFYMDGNPQPDDLICFEAGNWDGKELVMLVCGPRCWSFQDNWKGRLLFWIMKVLRFGFRFHFEEGLKDVSITPYVRGVRMPEWLVLFHMVRIDEDRWERNNIFFGFWRLANYMMRRIFDAERRPVPGVDFPHADCLAVFENGSEGPPQL